MAGFGATPGTDYTNLFGNVGGAVKDIFGGIGMAASADQYRMAAKLAGQNEEYTKVSTALKDTQIQRQVYKALGSEEAATSAAGFADSGSALDLLRESAQQGALQRSVNQQQGLITEAGYAEQQKVYKSMAETADTGSFFSFLGAGLKVVGALAAIF